MHLPGYLLSFVILPPALISGLLSVYEIIYNLGHYHPFNPPMVVYILLYIHTVYQHFALIRLY
jgi:hypothetical protein